MGSMTNEEYTTKFLELSRYVPYLKDNKAKFQRFVSGLPLRFKYWIDYDEPRILEEVIGKLKHCYKKSSVGKNLNKVGRGKKILKVNGSQSEQDPRM